MRHILLIFAVLTMVIMNLRVEAKPNRENGYTNFSAVDNNTVICEKLPMEQDGVIRLSKIEVNPAYLEEYMKFATEVGEISLRTEPGVLTMYALQEKDNPCNITILETYASQEAYRSHIASAHFQKYKQGTLHIVKKLVLTAQKAMNPESMIINYLK